MKVNFKDCEFGCFEPHFDIEYRGRKYRAVEAEFAFDDDTRRMFSSIVAEYALKEAMSRHASSSGEFSGEEDRIDSTVSFYADDNDGMYYILETINGEDIR